MRNHYKLFLNSDNAIVKRGTKAQDCEFSLNIGNTEDYNKPFCFVRLSYFAIKKTGYTTNPSILIKLSNPVLNTYFSNSISSGSNQNLVNENFIGVISTGSTSFTYSDTNFDNNYVKVGNILNGNINITLCDIDGDLLADAKSDSWFMMLDVYFDDC